MRKKILSSIAIRWRDFKTFLTREYVFGKFQDESPCLKYQISEEDWLQFCASRMDPSWQDKRQAAQQRQRLNDAPHVLSRGGYALLEQRLMKSREESAGVDSTDLASPPPRYQMWKAARTKSDGQMTSESARIIAQKIVSYNVNLN